MQVRDGMSKVVLTVGPGHSLREAAKQMSERDILYSLGHDQDVDAEKVCDHLTSDVVYAAQDWSLEKAAAHMVRGGFRHLIVMQGGEVVGVLSVRDVVRCWTDDGASCDMPEEASAA